MQTQMNFLDNPIPTQENIETSSKSRDALSSKKHHYRKQIYEFIKGKFGATCDEVEQALNLRHQTASCFIRFLTQDGLLKASEDRRFTRAGRKAIVWTIA